MSIYRKQGNGNLLQTEINLYGSSRLGMVKNPVIQTAAQTPQYLDKLGNGYLSIFSRGKKMYELTEHRGNVMVTLSDKVNMVATPTTVDPGGPGGPGGPSGDVSDVYVKNAIVVSANDYSSFGVILNNRNYNSDNNRFTYNGKELDRETGYQNYGERIYNAETAKFLSVDIVSKKYPSLTPYQFASNSPISGVDLDGKEFKLTILDPQVGNNFYTSVTTWKDDIYLARGIAYKAMNTPLSEEQVKNLQNGNPFGWGSSKLTGLSGSNQAVLEYSKDFPQGLTIDYNRGQYNGVGKITQVWAETMHYDKSKGDGDKSYPVDVRMIKSPEYGETYKNWDFVGTYNNYSSNIWVATASRGTMEGHLKGYGFVQYNVDAIGINKNIFGGQGLSTSGGYIFGKATPGYEITPSLLSGWGAQIQGGYSIGIGIEGGTWGSFDNITDAKNFSLKRATFTGGYGGFNVGVDARFKKLPIPSKGTSVSPAVTNSTLVTPTNNP